MTKQDMKLEFTRGVEKVSSIETMWIQIEEMRNEL